MRLVRLVLLGVGMLGPVAIATSAANRTSGFSARLTLPNGDTQLVKLEGVGCTVSICSRTHIEGHARNASLEAVEFDAIRKIESIPQNRVTLLMKDGSSQAMSLVTDFRVLYLRSESGAPEKLDFSEVKSVEFLGLQRPDHIFGPHPSIELFLRDIAETQRGLTQR